MLYFKENTYVEKLGLRGIGMTKEGVRRIKEINIKEEIDISENKNIEDSIEMCERSPHKLRIKYY